MQTMHLSHVWCTLKGKVRNCMWHKLWIRLQLILYFIMTFDHWGIRRSEKTQWCDIISDSTYNEDIMSVLLYDPVQALEYLLWASISLELSIPLMTAKYLPWIVTLYCAVCHCYYDNQAPVQAEVKHTRHLHPDTYKHIISVMSKNRLI